MISVLVVDDSAFMRKMISMILSADPEITICATAINGVDAIDKAIRLQPDVITLDVEMPEMDGITALKMIMKKSPTAVIMLSALTKHGGPLTIEALENGAIDFVTKPSGTISLDINDVKDELIAKVKAAFRAKRIEIKKVREINFNFSRKDIDSQKKHAVVIACSTGGPATLEQIIPRLNKNLPVPVFVVQHMPPGFTQSLATRLNTLSEIAVKEAVDGEEVKSGVVYLAPGGFHMLILRADIEGKTKEFISLSLDPPVLGLRPYANKTINSVVELYSENTLCVILTGMGNDGTDGAKNVKKNNGHVLAEEEKDCVIFGMPKSAIDANVVDEIIPLDLMAEKIMEAVNA